MGYCHNPYFGDNIYFGPEEDFFKTGAARQLAEQHRQIREAYGNDQIYGLTRDMRELRYRLDRIDSRFNSPPVATVINEAKNVNKQPSWLSRFWKALTEDPFWEFAKRPSLR